MLWIGHAGRCWPADVGLGVVAGAVVLVGLVVAAGPLRRDVIVVFGSPGSRLVTLLLGLEFCILAWWPVYRRAWRALINRPR